MCSYDVANFESMQALMTCAKAERLVESLDPIAIAEVSRRVEPCSTSLARCVTCWQQLLATLKCDAAIEA